MVKPTLPAPAEGDVVNGDPIDPQAGPRAPEAAPRTPGPAGQPARPYAKAPNDYRAWVVALVPAALGLLLFWLLFGRLSGGIVLDGNNDWSEIGKVGAIALIAFGSALLVRLVMAPLMREELPAAPTSDPNDPMRNRIAHALLIVGGASIGILTLSLVIAFAVLAAQLPETVGIKIDTLLMGLFGSVLPILATWVGTVIAFYFTNESYREAARVAQGVVETVKPTVAERMIFYDSIGRIEVDTRSEANTCRMEDIWNLMKEPVTRVLIFEKGKRSPIFIVRKSRIPGEWLDVERKKWTGGDVKVEDYRKWGDGSNGSDSIRFEFVPITATLEHARQVMRDNNVADIFVTARGQKSDVVLGWLTDDLLKGS